MAQVSLFLLLFRTLWSLVMAALLVILILAPLRIVRILTRRILTRNV